jgi:ATP-binding cassette subfamily B protein
MQNSESGTLKVLLRLVPFAKKAIPRLILGMFAGIAAHMFALAIPQLLQDLVNSLVALAGGRSDSVSWCSRGTVRFA